VLSVTAASFGSASPVSGGSAARPRTGEFAAFADTLTVAEMVT